MLDMTRHASLYHKVLRVCVAMAERPHLTPIFKRTDIAEWAVV
jgi:hypothetical protein